MAATKPLFGYLIELFNCKRSQGLSDCKLQKRYNGKISLVSSVSLNSLQRLINRIKLPIVSRPEKRPKEYPPYFVEF
jgi:hypothetical protein